MSTSVNTFEENENIDQEIESCEKSVQSLGKGKSEDYYKLEEGNDGNKLRILPALKGQSTPWYKVTLHFGLVNKRGKAMPIVCGHQSFDDCALCTESQLLREQGDNLRSWQLKAKDYFLYNVLDEDGNFKILSADGNLQKELIKQFKFARSEDGGNYSPWDIKAGCFIKVIKTKGVKKEGSKFPPNIFAVHLLARKPLSEDVIKQCGFSMHPLHEQYRIFTPKEILGIFDGTFDPYAKTEEKSEVKAKTTSVASATVVTIKSSGQAKAAVKKSVNVEEDIDDGFVKQRVEAKQSIDDVLDEVDAMSESILDDINDI